MCFTYTCVYITYTHVYVCVCINTYIYVYIHMYVFYMIEKLLALNITPLEQAGEQLYNYRALDKKFMFLP